MEVENIHKTSIDNDEKKKRKKNPSVRKPRKEAESQNSAVPLTEDTTTTTANNNATAASNDDGSEIRVSMFDYSVENHFREMNRIYKLCGEEEHGGLFDEEIERIASSITFLSEWRYFNYRPRTIRFVSETGSPSETEAQNEITLSQFSSAKVPKCVTEAEKESNTSSSNDSRKDFVLYAGGLVWSLDWCPRIDQESNSAAQCEFIAVAAHPPDSTYHKQGALLNGRGMIQIWCLLSCTTKEDKQAPVGSTKRIYKTKKVSKKEVNQPVRSRGRPRKNSIKGAPATDPEGQTTQALVVHIPEKALEVSSADETMLSLHTPQDISISVEKHKKEATKQKKSRGKAKKKVLDKTSFEDPDGQFIPALAVRLLEDALSATPMDTNVPSDPAPKKEKGKASIMEL